MSVVKTPKTLPGRDFPHFNLPILGSRGKHLTITTVIETQDRAVHHHEVVLILVLEVLANFAGEVVPHLNEAINASRDKELPIR